jgi:hypothetical protein
MKGRTMKQFLSQLPWGIVVIMCLTLGLAPFYPPHIWEKLQMLARGELVRPIDWFDLILHGTPWAALILKVVVSIKEKNPASVDRKKASRADNAKPS